MTRDEIAAVLERFPGLNVEGLGIPNIVRTKSWEEWRRWRSENPGQPTPRDLMKRLLAERDEWLVKAREALLDDWHVDAITRAESWLVGRQKIKTPSYSSYWLKHRAEKVVGYIANGDFIVAAIHLGFPIKDSWDSINPLVGISKKSIREGALTS